MQKFALVFIFAPMLSLAANSCGDLVSTSIESLAKAFVKLQFSPASEISGQREYIDNELKRLAAQNPDYVTQFKKSVSELSKSLKQNTPQNNRQEIIKNTIVRIFEPENFISIKHDNSLTSFRLDQENNLLLTTSNDKTAKITDIRTGQVLFDKDYSAEVGAGALHPDGDTFFVGHEDGYEFRKLSDKNYLVKAGKDLGYIKDAAFIDGGKKLVTLSVRNWKVYTRYVTILDSATGNRISEWSLEKAIDFQISPDQKMILLRLVDYNYSLYDLTGRLIMNFVASPNAQFLFLENSTKILLTSMNKGTRIYKIPTVSMTQIKTDRIVTTSHVSSDGKTLLQLGTTPQIKTYDLVTGVLRSSLDLKVDSNRAADGVFSEDGSYVAFNGSEDFVYVVDTKTGELLSKIPRKSDGAKFVLDDASMAVTSTAKELKIWPLKMKLDSLLSAP